MTNRKSRRAVFAALLLTASPTELSQRPDGISLRVDFGTIAELRAWLDTAGLNTTDLLTGEHAGVMDDGRPYRTMAAYPTWHGWKIYAHAIEYTDIPPLDTQARDRLVALTVA